MPLTFLTAGTPDAERLLPLVRKLYASEGLAWDERANPDALRRVLADPAVGFVVLILVDGGLVGYASVTWGFTSEFGGRFALLDELFVEEGHRGRGHARAVLRYLEVACAGQAATAMRLEVSPANSRALRMYAAAGYIDQGRLFLTKRLAEAEPSPVGRS